MSAPFLATSRGAHTPAQMRRNAEVIRQRLAHRRALDRMRAHVPPASFYRGFVVGCVVGLWLCSVVICCVELYRALSH